MGKTVFSLIELLIVLCILAILSTFILAINSIDPMKNETAKQAVLNCCKINGFTTVKILSADSAIGSTDDQYFYRVSAVNSRDEKVQFKVYWGHHCGATIRTD